MIRFSDKDLSSTWYFNAYFLNVLKIILIIYFVESKILLTTSYHGECPFKSFKYSSGKSQQSTCNNLQAGVMD